MSTKFFERYRGDKASTRLTIASGDGDEYPGCKLNIQFGTFGLYIHLPQWLLKPHGVKVFPTSWTAADVARLGRNWYMNYTERVYGVTKYENHVSILYGRQSHDSATEQRKGFFLPWGEYRMTRHALYDADGKLGWEMTNKAGLTSKLGYKYEEVDQYQKAISKRRFSFYDYDGELIEAVTFIEERTWHRGDGWFKWIGNFSKTIFRRALSIEFTKETGPKKGSWKGGTLGHGIDMLLGETHEAAFKRYCSTHNMKFIGEVVQ